MNRKETEYLEAILAEFAGLSVSPEQFEGEKHESIRIMIEALIYFGASDESDNEVPS